MLSGEVILCSWAMLIASAGDKYGLSTVGAGVGCVDDSVAQAPAITNNINNEISVKLRRILILPFSVQLSYCRTTRGCSPTYLFLIVSWVLLQPFNQHQQFVSLAGEKSSPKLDARGK